MTDQIKAIFNAAILVSIIFGTLVAFIGLSLTQYTI